MALVKLSSKEETPCDFEELLGHTIAVLKVSAEWCRPCRRIQPKLVELCHEARLPVFSLDIEKAQEGMDSSEFLNSLRVKALPTFFAFESGKIVPDATFAGASENDIAGMIRLLKKLEKKD